MKNKGLPPNTIGPLADYCRKHSMSIAYIAEGCRVSVPVFYKFNKDWMNKGYITLGMDTMEILYNFTAKECGKENAIHPRMYASHQYKIFND